MKYSVVELKAELIVTLIHYILSLHTKFNHLIILVLVKSHFTMYIIILVTLTIKGCGFLLENDVSTMLHVITQRIENFDHGKGLVAKCIKVTFTSDLIS